TLALLAAAFTGCLAGDSSTDESDAVSIEDDNAGGMNSQAQPGGPIQLGQGPAGQISEQPGGPVLDPDASGAPLQVVSPDNLALFTAPNPWNKSVKDL